MPFPYHSDVTFAIPRRNWTTGTVYDVYRHDYGERITGTTTSKTAPFITCINLPCEKGGF